MKQHVTVVPSDHLVFVDGFALCFDFSAPENMHALQWHEGSGHIEWTDDINHPLTPADYAEDVAPFVALWEAEKARRDEKAAAAGAARIAEYNSEPARAARIRAERDRRGLHTLLEVDGGVNTETGPQCAAAGADWLVTGSALFKAKDPAAVIDTLHGSH